MSTEKEVVPAHPEGEVEIAGNRSEETDTSIDTFAGKIHVKWVPDAAVSSLGLMPYFIEFLKSALPGRPGPDGKELFSHGC